MWALASNPSYSTHWFHPIMRDIEQTVRECFANVFPTIEIEDLPTVSQETHSEWDSLVHVTLVASLTEAFGTELDFEAFADAVTYPAVLEVVKAELQR